MGRRKYYYVLKYEETNVDPGYRIPKYFLVTSSGDQFTSTFPELSDLLTNARVGDLNVKFDVPSKVLAKARKKLSPPENIAAVVNKK